MAVGQTVTGTGIPSGTTIQNIDILTSTVTLSVNATASGAQTPHRDCRYAFGERDGERHFDR